MVIHFIVITLENGVTLRKVNSTSVLWRGYHYQFDTFLVAYIDDVPIVYVNFTTSGDTPCIAATSPTSTK